MFHTLYKTRISYFWFVPDIDELRLIAYPLTSVDLPSEVVSHKYESIIADDIAEIIVTVGFIGWLTVSREL